MDMFPLSALQKTELQSARPMFVQNSKLRTPPEAENVWSHALLWPQISVAKVVFPFLVTEPKSQGFTYNNIK